MSGGYQIAARDGFVLFDRAIGPEPWRNLKLVLTARKAPKRNWWFGWNGERLSNSSDAGLLAKHHPAIYQWVVETLQER